MIEAPDCYWRAHEAAERGLLAVAYPDPAEPENEGVMVAVLVEPTAEAVRLLSHENDRTRAAAAIGFLMAARSD
jgi:hypothetical protein